MRKWFVALTLLALLLASAPARAQGEVKFDSAVVQLWPEFDKPEMLVMVQLVLSSSTALPLDLDFRVPAGVTVQAVAVGQTQATVTDQGIVYATRQDGGRTVITIKNVTAPAIRIEYYDRLEMQGVGRHYIYQWPGDHATAALTAIFQQPVDATGLTILPAPVGNSTDANGLVYYQVDFGALAAGQPVRLTADYQKTTDRLSASVPQVQPESPLGSNAQGRVAFSNYLPWLVGGVGLVLIAVGLAIGLSYWRGAGARSAPRRKHAPSRAGKEAALIALYCPECGNRLQPGDQFCRACGTRLRSED